MTIYESTKDLPPFDSYAMEGRTYRYFAGEPLFPFGWGLSYTSFAYSDLTVPPTAGTADSVRVSAKVTNTGKLPGDEVVQLYVKNLPDQVPVAERVAPGFARVHLEPGESADGRASHSRRGSSRRSTSRAAGSWSRATSRSASWGGIPGRVPTTSGSATARLTLKGATFEVR